MKHPPYELELLFWNVHSFDLFRRAPTPTGIGWFTWHYYHETKYECFGVPLRTMAYQTKLILPIFNDQGSVWHRSMLQEIRGARTVCTLELSWCTVFFPFYTKKSRKILDFSIQNLDIRWILSWNWVNGHKATPRDSLYFFWFIYRNRGLGEKYYPSTTSLIVSSNIDNYLLKIYR